MEATPDETRVAATPDTVKKFQSYGCSVAVERGAGKASGYLDQAYQDQGAELVPAGDAGVWNQSDLVCSACSRPPWIPSSG